MFHPWSFFALGILVAYSVSASGAPAPTGLSCVEEMLLPSYGPIARLAARPGTVTSLVKIASNGKLASVQSTAPDTFLIKEVETFLRYNTTFKAACRGEVIKLKFTFRLGDAPPSVSPGLNVRFRGPNEFVIESQPQAAIPDAIAVPPTHDKD